MRRIAFIVLAGLAATLAGLVVHSALRSRDAELQKARLEATNIVVAARALAMGTKLAAEDVRVIRWPRDNMPAGATAEPQAVLGKIVKSEMMENEPIVPSRLFAGDTAGILSLVVPPDMRAMSVAVDEVSDIAGFVLPRARVDVLVAIKEQGAAGVAPAKAKIVLENVEVVAVAQTTEQKDKPQVEKVVTLLVTPAESERLALASQEGSLRLALRNFNDSKVVVTQGATVNTLLASYGYGPQRPQIGQVRMPLPPRPAVPAIKVEVMRDGERRDAVNFGADGRAMRPAVESSPRAPAQAPPTSAQAAPARPVQMVAGPPAQAVPAALPPDRPVTDANGNVVAFEGPDAKTIEAH